MSRNFGRRSGHRGDVLVRYRLDSGKIARVRLTVFEDGALELVERASNRRRRYSLRIDETELDQLRSALATLPAARWSRPTSQVPPAVRKFFRGMNQGYLGPTRFQLKRGHQVIFGYEVPDETVAAVLSRLDALRRRAQAHG